MKKIFILLTTLTTIIATQFSRCNTHEYTTNEFKNHFLQQVDDMDSYLTDSLIPLIKQTHAKEPLLATFKALRNKYKRLEWAVEYYMPTIARFVNGAPLPEIEQPEVVALGPHGLQVMEELIVDTSIDTAALHHETVLLKSYCISIKDNISAAGFTQEQLFDAVKKKYFEL